MSTDELRNGLRDYAQALDRAIANEAAVVHTTSEDEQPSRTRRMRVLAIVAGVAVVSAGSAAIVASQLGDEPRGSRVIELGSASAPTTTQAGICPKPTESSTDLKLVASAPTQLPNGALHFGLRVVNTAAAAQGISYTPRAVTVFEQDGIIVGGSFASPIPSQGAIRSLKPGESFEVQANEMPVRCMGDPLLDGHPAPLPSGSYSVRVGTRINDAFTFATPIQVDLK